MASEQKPNRPLVVSAIALLHGYIAARQFYFLWRASDAFRAGADLQLICDRGISLLHSRNVPS